MLPHQHAAVGLLAYLSARLLLPTTDTDVEIAIPAVLLGTQVPDLVDKPLAYYGVLPYGRSLMHSLLVIPIVLAGVGMLAWYLDRRHLGIAFSIGLISHPFADSYHALLAGQIQRVPYLLWPLVPITETPNPTAPWIRVLHIYAQPTGIELLLPAVGGVALLLSQRERLRVS